MMAVKKKSTKKSMEPGGGGRFDKLSKEIQSEGKSKKAADAIAASVGRKKYGKEQMAAWSSQGKKRSKK
jgi:hypothetical protein